MNVLLKHNLNCLVQYMHACIISNVCTMYMYYIAIYNTNNINITDTCACPYSCEIFYLSISVTMTTPTMQKYYN